MKNILYLEYNREASIANAMILLIYLVENFNYHPTLKENLYKKYKLGLFFKFILQPFNYTIFSVSWKN